MVIAPEACLLEGFYWGYFCFSSCPCALESAAGTSQSLPIKYCNTVNKFKDCILNDFFFSFLFSLTLVYLYDVTPVFHGPACRVLRQHICFFLVHGVLECSSKIHAICHDFESLYVPLL